MTNRKYSSIMIKKLRWAGSLTSIILLMQACGDKQAAQQQKGPPPPTAVAVATAQEGSAVYYDEFPGTVTPLNQVEIRPQVTGYITGIFFQDGQHVVKG